MKKIIAIGLAVALVLTLAVGSGIALADKPDKAIDQGNGAPSGPHYNLNIIGVQNPKTADMTGSNGHVIFVPLEGKAKILLAEGDDFQVLDANATKGSAKFQLPNPDPDGDGTTVYSVYARALGKPGGKADMTTYATDPGPDGIFGTDDDVEVHSIITLTVERTNGKQKFENVTKYLLYIYVDLDGDGNPERYPLFDEALEGYFWDYDNHGLKLLQLRFYPIETDVSESDGDWNNET